MQIFKKYTPLMLLIIFGTLLSGITALQYQDLDNVTVKQVKLISTDKSDFGYDPKTNQYEATDSEVISWLMDMNQASSGVTYVHPDVLKSCSTIVNGGLNTNTKDCIIPLPIGINQIKIVDKVTNPLKLTINEIEEPTNTITKTANGEIMFDVTTYDYEYFQHDTYQIYNFINLPTEKSSFSIDLSNLWIIKSLYILNTYIVTKYFMYLILIILCFWTAKSAGPRVNHWVTNFILFILINLMLFLTSKYLGITYSGVMLLAYNLSFSPIYLRIIWNNRKNTN